MNDGNYQLEVDKVTPDEWSRLLARFEDANLYQTWSYGKVRWGGESLSHLMLKREGEVVAMAQLRIIRPRFAIGGIAYLRWGPLCQLRGQTLDPEIAQRMASALHDEYVRKRRFFLRVLPNAFIGSERAGVFMAAFPQFQHAQASPADVDRTFLLDLGPSIEVIRKKLDQKWRNQLNRAEKNDLAIIQGNGEAEYRLFLEVYEKMWGRKQFETSVDVHEFARLNDDLPGALKFKILICQHAGKTVSGIVCSAMGNTGIYLLGATHDEGLNTKAAYLLQWNMIKQLKEQGLRHYDLGGIDPEKNPGVYHFKRGFSGEDVTRIAPLECCEDIFSSAGMKAADMLKGGLRGIAGRVKRKFARAGSGLKSGEKQPAAAPINS